jgi:DNA-binding transcriptional LysR family regulator
MLYSPSMLDAHRLRIFRAVVASGSVNRAAANLGYTPSAISQHLGVLQRETGLRLLERDGRGITPTVTGRLLADEAAAVLERLAALESMVADLREGRVGSLAVHYFASAGAAWIPPLVATLTREFPELRVDLRLIELVDDHATPDLEIFVRDPASAPSRGYDVRPVLDEPYLAVLPASHRLATWDAVPLRELADEAWVDNDYGRGPCRQVVLDACTSVGFSPGFQVETPDYPTAISFVAAGIGITVVPRLGIGTLPAGLVAVPIIDPSPIRHIAVRVRESMRDNPAARRFVDLLLDQVVRSAQHA